MLSAPHRMLRSEDFAVAVKGGVRSGNRALVVHLNADDDGGNSPALVGVVVPKKQVARATHRNRIKRRLRALLAARVDLLPAGSRLVVRGLAGADGASSQQLARQLDRALARVGVAVPQSVSGQLAPGGESV